MVPVNASKERMTFNIFHLLTDTFCWITQETIGTMQDHMIHGIYNNKPYLRISCSACGEIGGNSGEKMRYFFQFMILWYVSFGSSAQNGGNPTRA